MEESRKGTAPTPNTKATSASLDEDFGNDFLTSWKSTKFGNDAMDFGVGTSEGKGKGNKFNFGKLDDFDLDADFDKLPAFKMDMSDLDFSSPMKKNDSKAATEKSLKDLQGKDKEKKSFSFSFSFDDLGKFDLDPQVTSKEKKAAQLEPSTSVEFGLSKNQIRDLPTEIMDFSKIDSTKASSKPSTSSSTSRPPLTEKQTSKLPSYDLPKGSDQSTRKLFSVSSLSNGPSGKYREAQATQSHSVKGNSDNKTDSSVQLANQAQIMTSVMPVTSSNNRDNLSGAFSSDGGVSKTNSTTLSVQNESKRNSVGEKEVGVENGTDSTATTSSTQRQLKLNTRQEKETSSLLCKPQPNSALTSEQPDDSNPRTKLLNSDSQAMGRPSNLDVDHAKSSLITATEKASNIRASIFLGNKKPEHENRTVRALKNANGCAPIDNASPRIEKQILMANGLNSRLTKINQISPSATPENDLRSARFREVNRLPSQILTPILPNSASRGKPALISPPLKRKVAEDLVSDPFTPLKRISGPVAEARNSPTVALKPVYNSPLESRKPPEIALRSETDMVSRSETAEASRDNLKPPIQTVLSVADFEIPVLALENNGNVEKAESISKELGDISSMLKKKQEEAKQLLVRAIVSNNKLLMLNHPMYAEKLSSLERFASTLRAKYI